MSLQHKKLIPGGMLLLFLLIVACSPIGNHGSNQTTGTSSTRHQGSPLTVTAAATITPQFVTPKTVRGSPGKGPVVISSPTPVSGGRPGSQQIVLADRILIINRVARQKGASAQSSLISLDLTVRNTSAKVIKNLPTYFQLIASEGDTFGYQYNSSDNFYGTIAAHTARGGTIMFQVPAAASGLRLLYRPEIATETAIIMLKIL
jgi:hypothetical protein